MDILGRCEYCGQSNTDTSGKCYNPQCPSKQVIYSNNTGMTLDDKIKEYIKRQPESDISFYSYNYNAISQAYKAGYNERQPEIEKLKSQIYELQRQLEQSKNIKGA